VAIAVLVGLGLDYDIFLMDSVMEHRNMGKGGKAAVIEALDQVLLLLILLLLVLVFVLLLFVFVFVLMLLIIILIIDSVMEHRNMGKGGKAAVIEALDQVITLFILFLFVFVLALLVLFVFVFLLVL